MSLKRKNGKSVYSGDFTGAAPVLFAVRAGGKAEIDGKRYCADQGELLIPLLAAGFTVTVTSS